MSRVSNVELALKASPGAVLWRLSLPNVFSNLLITVVTIADAWFVGQLGTAALASLALVFPFQMLMQMFGNGAIGGGTASALSRALGAEGSGLTAAKVDALAAEAATRLTAAGFAKIDYVAVRDAVSLSTIDKTEGVERKVALRVLAAAWLGKTRLIDNVPL